MPTGSLTSPKSAGTNKRAPSSSKGKVPSLFSSAARRLLRGGTARTALVQPGAARFEGVLDAANRCPPPPPPPDELRRGAERLLEGDRPPPVDSEHVLHRIRGAWNARATAPACTASTRWRG